MANSLLVHNHRDLWSEVKRIDGHRTTVPNLVDGQQSDCNIGKVFAAKYESLYNSVPYNHMEMDRVLDHLESCIQSECSTGLCHNVHVIDVTSVTKALHKLKPNKTDGVENLLSDSLIHSCNSFHVHLSVLYTAMLRHGTAPSSMCLSTIIPIPKNRKKSLNDSTNYRAIALGSLFGKILDNIILCNNITNLQSCDLQFGFKAKHSTTQCSFVLEEIIDYYLRHDSPVYVALLDAS